MPSTRCGVCGTPTRRKFCGAHATMHEAPQRSGKWVKTHILERDGYRCQACGQRATDFDRSTLQTMCDSCLEMVA